MDMTSIFALLYAGRLARSGAASEAARSSMEPHRIRHLRWRARHHLAPHLHAGKHGRQDARCVVLGVYNVLILEIKIFVASYIMPQIDSIGLVQIYLSTGGVRHRGRPDVL